MATKAKFPVRIPEGWRVTITQPFKSTELAAWYKARGINMPEHNGVDIVVGDGPQTYGTACVWPFAFPGQVYDAWVDAPIGAKLHAHTQITGKDPATGIEYSLIFLHISGVPEEKKPEDDSEHISYKEGETVAWIGNNGAVIPGPTQGNPFAGAHLHLGLGIKKPGEQNFTMVDPCSYLDVDQPFRGPDDPSRDLPVYEWAGKNAPWKGEIPKPPFDGHMLYGTESENIARLQVILKVRPVSGYFGPATKAALIEYQRRNNIPPTGYIGQLTLQALNDGKV